MTTARSSMSISFLLMLFSISAAILSPFGGQARGQCQPAWLPGQGVPGVDGSVSALVVLPDGDLIVGGEFSTAGGVVANNIARYRPATNTWSALGAGVTGNLSFAHALVLLSDGDVVVGGRFTQAGGVAASNIARYSPATNSWSALGSGIGDGVSNSSVSALVVLPGGDVIAGGFFNSAGGMAASNIARYSPTTNTWAALGSGVGGSGLQVYALAVLPGGDVIAGGSFTTAGGVAANRIARFSPASNTWSTLGPGTNNYVTCLAVIAGGDLIAAGRFTSAGGVAANYIARYSPVTNSWFALSSGMTNSDVGALAVLPGGDVIVGGGFVQTGGVSANKIARYSPTSNTWSALGAGVFNSSVAALGVLPSGDVVAGGFFTSAGGVSTSGIARYGPSTDIWSALGAGTNHAVSALAVVPGGDVIVGGYFDTVGGVAARRIARYNPVSNTWSALASGTNDVVSALAVLPGGDVIAGGNFTSAGGVGANYVARYSPVSNTWSSLGAGTNGSVQALLVLPGGDVIVGGGFTQAGGVAASNIARYRPATNTWTALGSGTNSNVLALTILPGGDAIIGGSFTQAGGVFARQIARYDPTSNSWSDISSTLNGPVYALTSLRGGDVIVGGSFYPSLPPDVGGAVGNYVVRYSPADNTWSPIGILGGGTNSPVQALAVLPGGDVIVGGRFTQAGGMAANFIARAKPTNNSWSALGTGVGGEPAQPAVFALAVLPSGDVIAGGNFTQAGGNISAFFARYSFGSPEACCDPDLNQDGNADQADIDYLINVVAGGENPTNIDPDFNHDGNADASDIDALINVVAGGGCP